MAGKIKMITYLPWYQIVFSISSVVISALAILAYIGLTIFASGSMFITTPSINIWTYLGSLWVFGLTWYTTYERGKTHKVIDPKKV